MESSVEDWVYGVFGVQCLIECVGIGMICNFLLGKWFSVYCGVRSYI